MSVAPLSPPPSATPPPHGLWARARRLDPVMCVATVVLAAATYVPSFMTKPGLVADDSKQYLYLDPGKLIQSAMSMWNPDVGMGTVTHQNIGFLFPMGPYYWIVQELHIPMWVGQRFWMGSLFFFAGAGVFFLGKLLGLSPWGRIAAGAAYAFTPFVIDYIARISAIVMPWAALGWMVGLVILSVRRGGWRYPAFFAIVIALVGGVNATSILLAGLAPAFWIVNAVWVTKEVTYRRALAAVLRIGVLSAVVCLWWVAGLWAEGVYGLNILKFTETIPTVTSTSLSSEVIRGLGYWYFYGQDKVQPWTSAAIPYMQNTWLIGVGFALPTLCVAVGALARWRYRAFAVGLLFMGIVAAVAAYPLAHPSPFGTALRAAGSGSTIGLAMRSTNRIVPLVILGLALLLGSGVSALAAAHLKTGLFVLVVAVALAAADLPPLWTGSLVANNLARPEQLPGYVTKTANYLNTHGTGRVLGIPGEDFAYYRWGVTGDPVWVGLLKRPYVARQVVPQGEPSSVDLLQALDESIQDGFFVPSTLAPIARLMSAGDILFESDEQYERFNTARPQPLWLQLIDPTTGFGSPVAFGKAQLYDNIIYPLQDETQLGIPTGASIPPPTAVFAVSDPRPLVRTETPESPLLVAGSGAGLVNAAAAGLLDGSPTILYDASYAHDKAGIDKALADGAVLVLTDTNQRQQDDFGSINDNLGYVEQAGVGPISQEPREVTFGAFPSAGSAFQTVTTLSNVKSVQASDYGNPITNTPEDQAYNAFDQNPETRWAEGSFYPGTGAKLRVRLTKPVTASQIRLLQPQTGPRNRYITKVTLTFDRRRPVTVKLTRTSRTEPGQVVHFSTRSFTSLTITVDATSSGIRKEYNGFSGVGFADVTIPGVAPVVQTLRLPTSLLAEAGPASIAHPLVILMNRIRAAAVPPRSDPEIDMSRSFTLPTARTFSVGGSLRISAKDPDPVIDQLVGRTPVSSPTERVFGTKVNELVFANSSGRLPGDVAAGAYSAVDDNPTTSWMPGYGPQDGNWIQYSFDRPLTFDNLNLQLVTDGRHSIPTRLTITTDRGTKEVVNLPHVASGQGRPQGSTTTVPLSFPPITGQTVRITIDKTRQLHELDYYSNGHQIFPVGIAEVGFPGVVSPATPVTIPSQCVANLLDIDGTPIDVRVTGTSATALSGGALQISGCGNSANGITLSPGQHVVQTAPYQAAGLDVDALWLSSETGGGPLPLTATGTIPYPTPPTAATPVAHVVHQGRYNLTVKVTGNGSPYWLVLGQSQSNGWKASTRSGHALGSSSLVDGYANGWLVSGAAATGTQLFTLVWAPQHIVNLALAASAAGLAVSIVLVAVPPPLLAAGWESTRRLRRLPRRMWRRRRRTVDSDPEIASAAVIGAPEANEVDIAKAGSLRRMWHRSRQAVDSESVSEPESVPEVPPTPDGSPDEPVASVGFLGRLWHRSRQTVDGEPLAEPESASDVQPTPEGSPDEGEGGSVASVGFLGRMWHRNREAVGAEPLAEPESASEPVVVPTPEGSSAEGEDVSTPVIARDDSARNQPVLSSLLTTRGRRPRWFWIVIAALLTGGLAGAVTAWIAAPIIAGAVVVGCLIPWSRLLFVLAPVGLLAATGYYMVEQQLKYRYVSVIGWPASFPAANTLTWMAVVALLATAVVEVSRWRPWSLQPDPVKEPEPSPLPLPLLPDLPPMTRRPVEPAPRDAEEDEPPHLPQTPGSETPAADTEDSPADDEAATDELEDLSEAHRDEPEGETIDDATGEDQPAATGEEPAEPEAVEPEAVEPEASETSTADETQPSSGPEDVDGNGAPAEPEVDEPPDSD